MNDLPINVSASDFSKPPTLDFSTKATVIQTLLDRKRANDATIAMMGQLLADYQKDIHKIDNDARLYSSIAAGWTAVMIGTDTARAYLSIYFRYARVTDRLFGQSDKVISKLDKLLGYAGARRLKKEDLIRALGSEYDKPKALLDDVRDQRKLLSNLGVKESRQVRVVIDGVIAVAEDVMLFDSTLREGSRISSGIQAQGLQTTLSMREKIDKYCKAAKELDRLIMFEFEKLIRLSVTA